MITVYGVPGWGSTISELMLSLADIPYEVVDVEGIISAMAAVSVMMLPSASLRVGT
jgi:hypothetical protein